MVVHTGNDIFIVQCYAHSPAAVPVWQRPSHQCQQRLLALCELPLCVQLMQHGLARVRGETLLCCTQLARQRLYR